MLLGLIGVLLLSSCEVQPSLPWDAAPPGSVNKQGPVVRVRIARSVTRARIGAVDSVVIGTTRSAASSRLFAAPVLVSRNGGTFLIRAATGPPMKWKSPALRIWPARDGHVGVDGRSYPGRIQIHARQQGAEFDVVNHVLMEQYLPGVLDRELFGHWRPATFRAQAIAARSFAIQELARTSGRRHFDVESTSLSQAYGGSSRNAKSLRAVDTTRGRVLTYKGEVLPAYYSSCCGGTGQDASVAFPYGSPAGPLRGRRHGAWCAASKFHRWGPIKRPRRTFTRRLSAWGRANGHAIADLRSIERITISGHNRVGRPSRFTVHDRNGRRFDLGPEQFRFACNHEAPGVPGPSTAHRLRSAHVRVTVNSQSVVFTDGRGFGHGVGMCQYGGQALASAGYDEEAILGFFYRGAKVKKVY